MAGDAVTDLERIEFAVQFAQVDLDALRRGDWSKLRDDLQRLRWPSMPAFTSTRKTDRRELVGAFEALEDPEQELPDEVVRKIQQETRHLLNDIVDGREAALGRRPYRQPAKYRAELHWFPVVFADQITRQVEGTVGDQFIEHLFTALRDDAPDRVLRCPEPECGRLFVRQRKQTYCSRRCINRAHSRKWRERVSVKNRPHKKSAGTGGTRSRTPARRSR